MEYELELQNRFEVLNLLEEEANENSMNIKLNDIVETIDKSAEEIIGTVRGPRKDHW